MAETSALGWFRWRSFSRIAPVLALEAVPTGIAGQDEITGGGLSRGRTALVCWKTTFVDVVQIDGSRIDQAGDYHLDGLFIRMGLAIDAIETSDSDRRGRKDGQHVSHAGQ